MMENRGEIRRREDRWWERRLGLCVPLSVFFTCFWLIAVINESLTG